MNKNISHNHPFHLVTISPWPLTTSLSLMITLTGMVMWFQELNLSLFFIGILSMFFNSFQWWRDVIRESSLQGIHTFKVMYLLRLGMSLFIISELFFFISFFWMMFHVSLSPSIEIGNSWPPYMLKLFNPFNIPLLNTIVLLSSGISITWSHYSILNKNFKESSKALFLTIMLGIYFSFLQFMEYLESSYTISDSVFGSTFFLITGFHGIHVIVGTMFIMISYIRLKNLQFSPSHHFGFEASSWYWHFVDVIWLFVYISLYWWKY